MPGFAGYSDNKKERKNHCRRFFLSFCFGAYRPLNTSAILHMTRAVEQTQISL